jgi:hypothetical protein
MEDTMFRRLNTITLVALFGLGLATLLLMLLAAQMPASVALAGPSAAETPVATPPAVGGVRGPATGPDLAIQSLTLDPPNPAPGQPATITVVVKNVGASMLWDGFYTYLYVDPPQRPPTTTTPDTNFVGWFLGLNPGATFTWQYTDYVFETGGCNHVIYAWADRDNEVAEADETNNLASLNVCVGSATGDPYEPDDLCTSATVLPTDGTIQRHTFSPQGDQDWYQFTGIGGAEYLIVARNEGADADAALSLFARCNLPASFGGSSQIRATLPVSGTYYVKAINHTAGPVPQASYTISITSPFDCSGYYEPNNSRAAANDITPNAAAQRHRFCAPADEDWVKFAVQAGVTYTVRATAVGPQAAPTLVGSYGAGAGSSLFGNPLQFVATMNGTYYVRATNVPATAYGPTTDYDLAVTTAACSPDAFEPDNSRGEARSAVVNGIPDTRTACPAGDRDWVKFTATAGISYTLETVGLGATSDTILCLYDNIGTQIACDDESGASHGARLTWQATAGGEYYAEIRQADANAAGPATAYEFSVVTGLCRADLYEPDNSANNASLLPADGSRQTRSFCAADDRDWVRLVVLVAGSYTIQTTDLAPGSDTFIALYDTDRASPLADNDDFGPGLASQVVYNFTRPGTYYLEVRHFNPARYGRSTAYLLSATAGTPTATPTPGRETPTPTPAATATPPPSGIQTLILTNRERLTAIYGAGRVAPLFDRLAAFANHAAVQGEIVQVEGNDAVAAAYAAWIAAQTDVAEANQTAAAVRGLALSYLAAHPSVQYIVLVGDDRVIPARRIKDRTSFPESEYTSLNTTTTIGAAIAQDYFLTDDFYADREPNTWQGAELYIPDWAIGRLVETPEEIGSLLDAFLNSSQLTAGKTLVVGYDFVQDVATNICELMGRDLGNANLDCTLIGDSWNRTQFRDKQLSAEPPFKLQAINGHASHASEGVPVGAPVTARDVISGTADLTGALIYSVGCHAGLNVPETSNFPLDLPQAFSQKRVNYAGNTGFGWGSRIGVKLSERLMQNYTQELLKGTSVSIGRALAAAKQRYYQESDSFSEIDEKVIQQVTFYGFPMYRLNTGAVLGDENPFPSATISSPFGGANALANGGSAVAPGPDGVAGFGTVSIRVGGAARQASDAAASFDYSRHTAPASAQDASAAGFTQVSTSWGTYYQLDGHTASQADGPIQPQVYADLIPPAGQRLRGAVFTAGRYITVPLDPVINAPLNEYITVTAEPDFRSAGYYPPLPFVLRGNDAISRTDSTLAVVLGQYDSASSVERLYTDVQYDVYFSALDDQSGPIITSIDGYYNTRTGQATFKVEVSDPLTVTRVLIAYSTGAGSWSSFDLTYNRASYKWAGALPGVRGAQYYVQAVDSAGNATAVTRKGGYFSLDDVGSLATTTRKTYLPSVVR